jgi:CDP-4-dehydro-6-deoxyglucose reductase, E3
MTAVEFQGEALEFIDDESVLDGLLRHGHLIPHGCRAGVCQSCIMSAADGDNVAMAQAGLTNHQKSLNQFLSCQCIPPSPISVSCVDSTEEKVSGVVAEKTRLNEHVIRLRLEADLDYIPGQYVTLWKDDQLARSYSLASHPRTHQYLEFHIRHYPEGKFSSWVANELEVGDSLTIQGPLGECFYDAESNQPLLLAAIGTGLAPVYGILQDALVQSHEGPITLVVGAKHSSSLYLLEELQVLASTHDNLQIHLVAQDASSNGVQQGDIYQYCKSLLMDLGGYRVYLCGAESFVTKMRKQCFLAGAGMSGISADVFLHFGDVE